MVELTAPVSSLTEGTRPLIKLQGENINYFMCSAFTLHMHTH